MYACMYVGRQLKASAGESPPGRAGVTAVRALKAVLVQIRGSAVLHEGGLSLNEVSLQKTDPEAGDSR